MEQLISQGRVTNLADFDDHSSIVYIHDKATGMSGIIAIHRTHKDIPSFGATRMMEYASDIEALADALRLSKGMSYKAALAGLPCGGAKGIIIKNDASSGSRKDILQAYAEKISILKNTFITGLDVGLMQSDLALMKEKTPNIIGFNENSTEFTGLGVYYAIQSSLNKKFGSEEIKGKSFAIQGLGKVGGEVIRLLYTDAERIFVSDTNRELLEKIEKEYPKVIPVPPEDIHKQEVDVFCPCALSHSLNIKTVSEIKSSIIAGGANNQLESKEIGSLIFELGIIYTPDYVANSGGLIAVFDEYEHSHYDKKRVSEKVLSIKKRLEVIFSKSESEKKATHLIADKMAEDIFNANS